MNKRRLGMAALTAAVATGMVACSTDGKGSTGASSSPAASAAATAAPEKVNLTGFPIVNEPLNVTFFTGKAGIAAGDWSQVMLWQEYEKKTNIKVKFDLTPSTPAEALQEKRNLALASGEYPDAFYQAQVQVTDLIKYGSQGVFVKLNDYIDKYAPNFKKLLESNPVVKKAITMPDGGIYSFPWAFDPNFTSLTMGPRVWINKTWLDKLNMKEPTTTEEFYAYLKAVKETDLNGNGQNDEIPFSGVGIHQIFGPLKGAFGLGNKGNTHVAMDLDPATDKLRFFPADPKYKDLLQYVNKLYTEGLVDRDVNTQKTTDFYAKASKDVYGAVVTSNPRITMKLENFVGLGALKGPHGDQIYSFINPSVPGPGAFVITNKTKNVEALVRWIDYFYSPEGSRNLMIGFKDVTYKELPDGKFELLDEVKKNPQGLTQDQALSKYVTYPGGSAPTVVFQENYAGSEAQPDSLATAEKVKPYVIKEAWPLFTYPADVNDKLISIRTDLYKYIDENTAKFIMGAQPFSAWDSYVEGFKKVKSDEFMKINEEAYERFKK